MLLVTTGRFSGQFSIRNPQSAIRNPQSAIRNPQSAIERGCNINNKALLQCKRALKYDVFSITICQKALCRL
jgi:hypothetical protein